MEAQCGESQPSCTPRRILFIELLGGISDLMMALPSMQALARSNPQAELEVLTSTECAPLLYGEPLISRVHTTSNGEASGDDAGHAQLRDLETVLNGGSYDVIVSDARNQSIESAVEESGAAIRVSDLWDDSLPEQLVEERFLQILVEKQLIDPHHISMVGRITLNQQETKWARCWRGNNLLERHPTVILNPDTEMAINRWPVENFIAVGRFLTSRNHCNIVVLSGDEPELARMIGHEIGKGATILAKCGLRQVAAIASLSSLIVSADGGLARVAAAAGSKAIVLFGPTSVGRYGLRAPHVNIRSPRDCDERGRAALAAPGCGASGRCVLKGQSSCVNDIAPDVVMRASERALHA